MFEALKAAARKPAPRGTSGLTHCGAWKPMRPGRGFYMTRLVCTEPAGHVGEHHNRHTKRSWPLEVSDDS